jgi:hypothetical protein
MGGRDLRFGIPFMGGGVVFRDLLSAKRFHKRIFQWGDDVCGILRRKMALSRSRNRRAAGF